MKRKILVAIVVAAVPALVPATFADDWDGVSGKVPDDVEEIVTAVPEIFGPLTLLHDPKSFVGSMTMIGFDDAEHFDAVNLRYLDQGVRFERDDGGAVHAYDFCGCNHETTSPPMTACTSRGPGSPCIGCAVHVLFDSDVRTVGFAVGNDAMRSQVWTVEVFDEADVEIGRLTFTANANGDADEYFGVTSPIPFRRVRISQNYRMLAVCIDDVTFSPRGIVAR